MPLGTARASGGGSPCRRGRPNLVEAAAAVHGPIVPRGERDDGLAATAPADRRMELSRPTDGSSPLRHRPTGRAALGVVQQALAREKRLLPTGEDELTCAVAAGEGSILEHALPVLLVRQIAPAASRPPTPTRSSRRRNRRGRAEGRAGSGPELMSRRIDAASSGFSGRTSPRWPLRRRKQPIQANHEGRRASGRRTGVRERTARLRTRPAGSTRREISRR